MSQVCDCIWNLASSRDYRDDIYTSRVSHMNESFLMCVIIDELCLIYQWVMSHVCDCIWTLLSRETMETICYILVSACARCQQCECVTSYVWIRQVSCAQFLMYGWVMSTVWMSHVSRANESCLMYEWVMSHVWMSHVSCMNESCLNKKCLMYESCLTCEWVMSHAWMSHVTCMEESCLKYE